jgi:choice-of-anchor A domain-containing protein
MSLHAGYLGPADGYNGFFFGNYTNANSDVGGKLAAGGNISLLNMGVAVQHGANFYDGQYALIAAQNLAATNGQLYSGNAFHGNLLSLSSFNLLSGSVDGPGASPIDFPAAETELKNKSQALKNLGGTAVSPNAGFEFILNVASSPLAIFLIDSADFCSGCTVKIINVAANSTVVVNVKGVNVASTNAAYFINGMAINGDSSTPLARQILFNYYEATSLYMNSGVQGSVLAPYANVTSGWGQMVGQLVAQSYSNVCTARQDCGSLELHDFNFDGELEEPSYPTPEPSTWLLSAAGLAGLAWRRARTAKP